jgi:glycosyltransferase involved in cell wall biosynthesis
VAPEDFARRELFIKSQLEHVDLFLAPSRFLMSQYIAWGIPEEKIRFHEYGRRVSPQLPVAGVETRKFVFLGQAMRHKGILVLLRAMKRLIDAGRNDVFLYIDGANMDFDGDAYVAEVQRELEKCKGQVIFRGSYTPDEISGRLADVGWVVIPSIWWENSPLVIQEAFMAGRPVLCSDVGGMAEKVEDGVNGLHFRAGDDAHLAEVIGKVAGDERLWTRLRDGIRPIYSLDEALADLEEIYHELLGRTRRDSVG